MYRVHYVVLVSHKVDFKSFHTAESGGLQKKKYKHNINHVRKELPKVSHHRL